MAALLLPCCVPAVSRVKARSDLYEMDLTLDINTDVFPGACRASRGSSGWRGGRAEGWCASCHDARRASRGAERRHAPPLPVRLPVPMPPAVEVGDKLVICLASTLSLDGTPSSATFDAVRQGRAA